MKKHSLRQKTFALILLSAVWLAALPVFAQNNRDDGKGVGIKTVSKLPARDKRWALIIGVDDYQDDNISDLRGAANDAKNLAESLEKYAGFPSDQIILLATTEPAQRQPTRANILRRLSNLRSLVPKDGLLLVSFSGHGIERGNRAFLIPSDATSTEDVELLEETALSVENMKRQVKSTNVQQVLFLLDACRNDPTSGRSDSANPLTAAYQRGFSFDVKNKEIEAFATIYATSVGARAYEYAEKRQGYFSWAIVEALSGKAANQNGEVTLGALVKYVEERVPKMVAIDLGGGKVQRPFAQIEGYKADELVLAISGKVEPVPTPRPTPVPNKIETVAGKDKATLESEAWDLVKNSSDAQDFRTFLNEFPNGANASNAKIKLEQIIWASVKTSGDPARVKTYLDEFPNGANAPAGRILYGQLTRPKVQPTPTPNTNNSVSSTPVNSNSESTAAYRNPKAGMTLERPIGNGLSMKFTGIPAGSFTMGSPASENERESDEGPQRTVTIGSGFWMSKYEVTQEEYEAVMGTNPSNFTGCPKCPVERVSWNDAQKYIKRLNAKNDGFEYRLPTEAEWEYAARAGTTTAFSFGDAISSIQANFDGNYPYGGAAKGQFLKKTTPVGSYQPNAWGLYDMHGNVWEWCEDIYKDGYSSLSTDGSANVNAGDSSKRVFRGGSWLGAGGNLRSANRKGNAPANRILDCGFRVVVRPR